MPRVNATAPPDAIRIEDEVWQEAFARREPGQAKARRRLQAADGDWTSSTLEPHAAVGDRTGEPAEGSDWLPATAFDSGTAATADPAPAATADPAPAATADPAPAATADSAPAATADSAPAVGVDSAPAAGVGSALPVGVDSAPVSRVDSAPMSRAGSVRAGAAADWLGEPSGAGSLTRPTASSTGGPVRRTVTIRGRGAEGHLPWPDASRGRPHRRAYERTGFRPDRLAMWAVLLGFLLVLVAILSAH